MASIMELLRIVLFSYRVNIFYVCYIMSPLSQVLSLLPSLGLLLVPCSGWRDNPSAMLVRLLVSPKLLEIVVI